MQNATTLKAGSNALAALLEEFRAGNITNKKVGRQCLERHLGELSKRWDERFPGFPDRFPYSSIMGSSQRIIRDVHLKKIIIKSLKAQQQNEINKTVLNPACFVGRQARYLAARLEGFRVIAMDINPRFNWCYGHICKTPDNYEFRQDDIFNPAPQVTPAAVVFFGACGSVSDAAIDYAIELNSPYLFCRTCCHQNIGENLEIRKRFTLLNWSWQLRQLMLSRIRKKKKGYYFSEKYSKDQYPRSKAAGALTNSDEFSEVARNAADSDLCRAIIDLDRYLYLTEKGYNAWYKGEMFIAERTT